MLCVALQVLAVDTLPGSTFEATVREQGRAASQLLMTRLGARLKAAIQEGGVSAAVDACHLEAQPLTAQTSTDLGIRVGRTALRVRNPVNAPDAWETAQLERFQAQLAAGVLPDQLEAIEHVQSQSGVSSWRYMKPIMTGGLCLNCHGDTLQPEVAELIRARYPSDEAVGFSAGELRGAFTITIPE